MSQNALAELREDMIVLVHAQQAFESMQAIMARKDSVADTLADVWNSQLDLRDRLLHKMLSNPLMQQAGLEESLLRVLNNRKK